MCNNWPDFPIGVVGATGGLIGDTVIICGGYTGDSFPDECYSLTSKKTTLVNHMSIGKSDAASIVLNDNTLWVTGGWNNPYNFIMASNEYFTMAGTILGPDLPIGFSSHAMVAINSTWSMVIGGSSYSGGCSALTFLYDHNEGKWTTGPSLMQGRRHHAAGIVTDEVTNENSVAVTGGDDKDYENGFDSTEIFQDGKWVQGKINK